MIEDFLFCDQLNCFLTFLGVAVVRNWIVMIFLVLALFPEGLAQVKWVSKGTVAKVLITVHQLRQGWLPSITLLSTHSLATITLLSTQIPDTPRPAHLNLKALQYGQQHRNRCAA